MLSRPLLQKILLFIIIALLVLLVSSEVIYYFFEGQLKLFNENKYVRYAQWTFAITAGLLGVINFLLSTFPKKILIERPKTRALLLRLLNNVETSWVKGILENSIHHAVLLELGKEWQPNQVSSPWQMALELPQQQPRLLPTESTIEQVFTHEAARSLLILGESGSGKTTTLLTLTRDLIAVAKADTEQPIPVVFNLSSWAEQQLSLSEWLVSELRAKYQIPQEVGKVWLENHWLLPLLDGLDEVQAGARVACVAAINTFIPNTGVTGIVVCCRREEYEALGQRLQLQAAIGLQPLHPEQVLHYVAAGGEKLAGLRTLLQQDTEMLTLAETPLMLSIMSLAYQDVPATALTHHDGDKQTQLFERYLDKMFKRRPAETKHYPKTQALHYLTWLAQNMQQRGQTVFLVERLQPNWLPSALGYRLLLGIAWGIFWMIFFSIAQQDSWFSLQSAIFWGFIMGIVSDNINPIEILDWSWDRFWKAWWENTLIYGLIFSLLGGWIGGLAGGFATGLTGGLGAGLAGGMFAGFKNQLPEKTLIVNQGIIASFHNMWRFGTLFGLTVAVISWTSSTTVDIVLRAIGVEVSAASGANFLRGLFMLVLFSFPFWGGLAVAQHFILRTILWLEGYTPLNFIGFLDYAARLIVLRKVGGGYVFVHRLLLEHLARRSES